MKAILLPWLGLSASPLAIAQVDIFEANTLDAGFAISQNAEFGQSIASDGDWLAVGSPFSQTGTDGTVQLFERLGGSNFDPKPIFSSFESGAQFGAAVDVDLSTGAPTVFVGAPRLDPDGQTPNAGGVYVLDWNGAVLTTAGPEQLLDDSSGALLGTSVAVEGGVFVAGRPGTPTGEVKAWERIGGVLMALSDVEALPPASGDQFGTAVDLRGGLLAVGAPGRDVAGVANAGAVFLYEKGALPLQAFVEFPSFQTAQVISPTPVQNSGFGSSVAIEGDLLAVGAPLEFVDGAPVGAVYIFRRTGLEYVFEQRLQPTGLAGSAQFGSSLDLSGGTLRVGAPFDQDGVGVSTGTVWTFEQSTPGLGPWASVFRLVPLDAMGTEQTGRSVASIGDVVAAGAPRAALDNSASVLQVGAGAVRVFDTGTQLCVEDLLTSQDLGAGNGLGAALTVELDTLVAGQPFDDVQGTDAGSLAIFARQDGSWVYDATLRVAAPSQRGELGAAIDLQGDTLLAGAPGDRTSLFAGGRGFLWERSGPNQPFGDPAELHSSSSAPGDRFGAAVALTGELAVITSPDAAWGEGSAHVFRPVGVGGAWQEVQRLEPAGLASGGGSFGTSLAANAGRVALGSPTTPGGGAVTSYLESPVAVLEQGAFDSSDPELAGFLALSDFFGSFAIEPLGDIDGDGNQDIAVGAPGDDGNGTGPGTGAVYILRLDGESSIKAATKLTNGSGGLSAPLSAGIEFGSGLAYGQFDGDAELELAVGAMSDNSPGTDAGSLWIVDISPNGLATGWTRFEPGDLGLSVPSFSQFGFEVENAGDLDGDGVDELLVSAVEEPILAGETGAIYAIRFDDGLAQYSLLGKTVRLDLLPLSNTQSSFGLGIAKLGDLDGNGSMEFALTDYGALLGPDPLGTCVIAELQTDGAFQLVGAFEAPDGDPADFFGRSVTGLGDVDGNGVPDVLVAATNDDDSLVGAVNTGSLWIFMLDAFGSPIATQKLSPEQGSLDELVGVRLGLSTATLPSTKPGGSARVLAGFRRDLLTPVTGQDNSVQVFTLGPGLALETAPFSSALTQPGDAFGASVAVDVDGLVVGAPGADSGLIDAGAATAFLLTPGASAEGVTLLPDLSAGTVARFGETLLLSPTSLVVGAPGVGTSVGPSPRVAIFERVGPGNGFVPVDLLGDEPQVGGAGDAGDRFGAALGNSGNSLLVGAPGWDGGLVDQGTVYSFEPGGALCLGELSTVDYLSVGLGGEQSFWYQADPGLAGTSFYQTLFSLGPGPLPLGSFTLPLDFDAVLNLSLSNPNSPPFVASLGPVPAGGLIESQFAIPPDTNPALAGARLYAATVVFEAVPFFQVVEVSGAEFFVFLD